MNKKEERRGQDADSFCSLTISVHYGWAAGVEGGSALHVSLILPLLLVLVRRLMCCFDLVLQHGEATDWYNARDISTRHLDELKSEKG